MLKTLYKWLYRSAFRQAYSRIDALHYLKRLNRVKPVDDEWYYSDKDATQYTQGGRVLRRSRYRDVPIVFECTPTSHIERRIIRDGLYGVEILALMCDFAKPDTLVVDIGANIGCYAIPFAKARNDCVLHAIEPNPAALSRLKRNLTLNEVENVVVHCSGLADRRGNLTFYACSENSGDLGMSSFIAPPSANQADPILVDVTTLDELLTDESRTVSVIKIDVQGFEANVLRGAVQVISRSSPVIIFEHEDCNFPDIVEAQHAKDQIAEFFLKSGYSVYYLTRYSADLLLPVDWNRPLNGNLLALPSI